MRTLQRRFALIRRYVLGVSLLVPLLFAQGTQPQAAIVNFDASNQATSITGLVVGANTYTIDYETGTYATVFPGGDLFLDASGIADEIVTALNAAGHPLIASSGPAADGRSNRALFAVPFFTSSGAVVQVFTGRCPDFFLGVACSVDWDPAIPNTVSQAASTKVPWAVPTLTAVPLPAALPLFGSALAMLGIVGWRRRRQADA